MMARIDWTKVAVVGLKGSILVRTLLLVQVVLELLTYNHGLREHSKRDYQKDLEVWICGRKAVARWLALENRELERATWMKTFLCSDLFLSIEDEKYKGHIWLQADLLELILIQVGRGTSWIVTSMIIKIPRVLKRLFHSLHTLNSVPNSR